MMVTFRTVAKCADCGADWPGIMVRTVRINKGSLRGIGTGLGGFKAPESCATHNRCGEFTYLSLDEESTAKVNAWRAAKGWPLLKEVAA